MSTQNERTTPRPFLSSTSAQLSVSNIQASFDFFTDKLGFAIDFVCGEPAFYGQVIRDKTRLALRLVREPVFVVNIREREHLLAASITVDTADELKQLFLRPGVYRSIRP